MKHFISRAQRGITLLEVIMAIGIMGAVVAGVAMLMQQSVDDTKASTAAQPHSRTAP